MAIGREAFAGVEARGRAVLVRTGFSQHWRTERYQRDNPHLTGDACDYLLDQGVTFVGIDSVNVDALSDLARPAHTKLLGAGVPVGEHFTGLEAVDDLIADCAQALRALG